MVRKNKKNIQKILELGSLLSAQEPLSITSVEASMAHMGSLNEDVGSMLYYHILKTMFTFYAPSRGEQENSPHCWWQISKLAQTIQQHAFNDKPTPISIQISAAELMSPEHARQAMSDWILLLSVANTRLRQEACDHAHIGDMHGKFFLHQMTARLIGKLSRGADYPKDFKPLMQKVVESEWIMRKDKKTAVLQRDLWIDMTAHKILRLLPAGCDIESCERSVKNMLQKYTCSDAETWTNFASRFNIKVMWLYFF